ncbi:hypothetical protein X801_10188 [Opisthorchis viverrini]|uniref:OBG-type G domain-containing protein n=1 Tax=Opisthorchis viverrini TaxID=6198 RepID=A0A1S8WHV4_OPIVI|nr:hypothetical protein X801_10188 [Opisthorchis viverrini]
MGILDKIAEIENEIARTQKNKVLQSTLLNSLTSTHSECASYEFTTLTCIPGVIEYNGANIQLLDLPGIIEGASQGKGRGRQVIAVARTADLVIIMLDATKPDIHRTLLERELEAVGIRLNKRKPNIYFKQKKTGGLKITSMVPLTRINEKMTQMILQEYKIFNAEVIFREDCTPDEFIDVVSGNRVYMGCLYVGCPVTPHSPQVYNKIDQISLQEVDRLAREPHSVVVSCNLKLNLDYLLEKLWEHLDLIQVYTKKRGGKSQFLFHMADTSLHRTTGFRRRTYIEERRNGRACGKHVQSQLLNLHP